MIQLTTNNQYKNNLNQQKAKSNVNFKGAVEVISSGLAKVEATPALSLFAIDLFGMILPRTWIDLKRNREELGHLNWDAGRETALRENSTAFMLYFLPGLSALGVGNALLNTKFNKYGLNTRSFVNFNMLKAARERIENIKGENLSLQELRSKFVESMLEGATANIDDSRVISKPTKDKIIEYVKNNTEYANIDKFVKNSLPTKDITEASQKIFSRNKVAHLKNLETYHQEFIKKISDEIAHSFEESKIKITDKAGMDIVNDIKTFIRDVITLSDDLVIKAAQNSLDENGVKADKVFDAGKFKNSFKELANNFKNIKAAKLALGFGIGLASLISFPLINIWITKKLSHNEAFPGIRGLTENQNVGIQHNNNKLGVPQK